MQNSKIGEPLAAVRTNIYNAPPLSFLPAQPIILSRQDHQHHHQHVQRAVCHKQVAEKTENIQFLANSDKKTASVNVSDSGSEMISRQYHVPKMAKVVVIEEPRVAINPPQIVG